MDRSGITLAENMRRLAGVPLLFAPGTRFSYSLATDIVGAVIEAATGMPLPEALRELVTKPPNLTDIGFGVSDAGRLAVAYADDTPRPLRMREPDLVPFLQGTADWRWTRPAPSIGKPFPRAAPA